jgi:Spy/CpxP family protein refolding chaperone
MNTTTMLAEALQLARECQYQIREEDLEGAGGGHCSFSGKKWLLLDITQSAQQQLEDTLDALRCEPKLRQHSISAPMATLLAGGKRAA